MTKSKTNTTSTATSIEATDPSQLPRVKPKAYGGGSRSSATAALVKREAQGLADLSASIQFVELLGRSNFSFLQGASHPEEMILQAQKLGYKGLALCDLNGLYGVVKAHKVVTQPSSFLAPDIQAEEAGFSFHCGSELHLKDGSSLTLLPMNKDGYHQLCQLITLAKRSAPKGFSRLSLQDIYQHSEDLIAFPLPPWDRKTLKSLHDIFRDRLYLPVWKDYTWDSIHLYSQALELEQQMGLSLFATQRPFMHSPKRKPLHDILTCILHKTTLEKAKTRLIANSERHLKPLHELAYLWRERPDMLSRTLEISSRLQFSLDEVKYQYPREATPPNKDSTSFLRELTEQGLEKRFPQGVPPEVQKQAEHELGVIGELQYEDYFLTLWDICEFARSQGILCQGRGSAANSVVCYAIGLTSVDPTKVQLLFERFISKERGEPPDIDIDFANDRREEVIQYIYQKYGQKHAAMVSTVTCYRSRMALREVAKVLSIDNKNIDALIKFMGREGLAYILKHPEKAEDFGFTQKKFQLLLDLALQLQGFPRHLGIHTGGFLIAQRPITECVPVEKATMDGRYVIQWNKDDLTTLKMMKIDVLALGMLTALQKTFEMLKKHKNLSFDLYNIPPDDKDTYSMVQKADTVGVFQIESRAQMSILPRLRPECFYDLVVEVAIVRPGPIQGGMVHPYIRRKCGEEKVTYPHPDLKPILGRTFGVPIFQEQLMQIASTVGGFTPGEADELRRVMSSSWRKPEIMEGIRKRLLNGMLNHGVALKYAEQIYKTIEGFSSYGFPESHAASFALITYASCYVKQHHPETFTCALLNSQPMGFYSPRALVADAQRHRVRFLPLDVQRSFYDYTIEKTLEPVTNRPQSTPHTNTKWAVRVGFRAIHRLQKKHIERMLDSRQQHGPFKDLSDFIQRTQLSKPLLMSLAAAGAFRSLGLNAREALWKIQALNLDQQSLLFGLEKENFARPDKSEEKYIPQENMWEEMQREYHWQGYSLTKHPLGLVRPAIDAWSDYDIKHQGPGFYRAEQLAKLDDRTQVRVAGLLSLQQRPPTAKGFTFLSLEDETGILNIVITPQIYEKVRHVVNYQALLEVRGFLEKTRGVINVKAQDIRALPLERLLNYIAQKQNNQNEPEAT